MKRAHRLLALTLCVALSWVLLAPAVGADPSDALSSLMEGVTTPDTYEMNLAPALPEGSDATGKELSVSYSGTNGETAKVVVQLSYTDVPNMKTLWSQLETRYNDAIIELISKHQYADLRALAGEVLATLESIHENLSADPEFQGSIEIHNIQVTSPYYEELTRGSKGQAVARLQAKLIELGFLDGDADGQFGSMTANGVKALQEHVRSLEQEIIDAMPEPTPIPVPVSEIPTPQPEGEEGEEVSTEPVPSPTPIPVPKPDPETEIDGIADAELQAYLYSNEFTIAGPTLAEGDKGSAVTRLQNRLTLLGCMTGEADGFYGADTLRGIRIFQHYNGMAENGIADHDLQTILYSDNAKKPTYPLMTEGSKGDEVRYLQERLKKLGFMVGEVDGGYGPATVSGVKHLQTYMKEMQVQKLQQEAIAERDLMYPEVVNDTYDNAQVGTEQVAQATPTPRPTPKPIDESKITIEVNGIADPMLMDEFFADSFPVLPSPMTTGSKGLDVERLQRRLYDLEYWFYNADGDYGDGTLKAVRDFQERNGLAQDGIAGAETISKIFSNDVRKALRPYMLRVSIDKQRVYAYAPDENEEYTRLVRTMKCSTGLAATPTITGTYQGTTGPGARWHFFKKFNCWAQYAYYIEGDYMFHSVLYGEKNGPVTRSSVNNLGRRASHGCVRLTVEDAKWIWTNCPVRTKVVIN